jgi:hypothetical protein
MSSGAILLRMLEPLLDFGVADDGFLLIISDWLDD